jgi:hypothetical protein
MSDDYEGTRDWVDEIDIPTDDDEADIASIAVPLEQLADRTVALVPRYHFFNTSGTFTPNADCQFLDIEATGPGGDGGAAGGGNAGGGGGGGEYRRARYTVGPGAFSGINAAFTVVIDTSSPFTADTTVTHASGAHVFKLRARKGNNGADGTGGGPGAGGAGMPGNGSTGGAGGSGSNGTQGSCGLGGDGGAAGVAASNFGGDSGDGYGAGGGGGTPGSGTKSGGGGGGGVVWANGPSGVRDTGGVPFSNIQGTQGAVLITEWIGIVTNGAN